MLLLLDHDGAMMGWLMFSKVNNFLCVMIKKNGCIVLENDFSRLVHSNEKYSAGSFIQLMYKNCAFKKI